MAEVNEQKGWSMTHLCGKTGHENKSISGSNVATTAVNTDRINPLIGEEYIISAMRDG